MKRSKRDTKICHLYIKDSLPLEEIGERYNLSRQRIKQIVLEYGLWRPRKKSDRVEFLGVNINAEDKKALFQLANDSNMSMSQLVSDAIKIMLKALAKQAKARRGVRA